MHSNVPWLNELRGFDGDPYLFIHETAAAERGIVTGDTVRVFNERGHVVLRAVTTKGIREDTINIPRGYEDGELIDGHLQSLTSIDSKDRITNNDCHNDWLCQVEKV
jgi:molybdopterin-containing oxidoreductase family molybdopterin binding subunit